MLPTNRVQGYFSRMAKKETAVSETTSEERRRISSAHLKKIFEAEGSQAEIARKTGVPATTISRWIREGADDVRGDSFKKVMRAAGYVPDSAWEPELRPIAAPLPPTNLGVEVLAVKDVPGPAPDTKLRHEILGVKDVPEEPAVGSILRQRLHDVLDRILKDKKKAEAVTLLLEGLDRT